SAHSAYRKLTSLVHYWLVRALFGVTFRDMNFVQVYKREALARLLGRAKSPAFVTPQLIIPPPDPRLEIAPVQAAFPRRKRGQANYGKARDILWSLADMLSYRVERWRGAA